MTYSVQLTNDSEVNEAGNYLACHCGHGHESMDAAIACLKATREAFTAVPPEWSWAEDAAREQFHNKAGWRLVGAKNLCILVGGEF